LYQTIRDRKEAQVERREWWTDGCLYATFVGRDGMQSAVYERQT